MIRQQASISERVMTSKRFNTFLFFVAKRHCFGPLDSMANYGCFVNS
ncbi:MAG: hypothetical protein ACD_67C00138G0001 [uncultured bacterium]|nr:MAG: hypothetical protein ACD_67C00138G0001 [uncultured bacterium]